MSALDSIRPSLSTRRCETCNDDLRCMQVEFHVSRCHDRQPTKDELLLEVRESNRIIGKLLEMNP